MFIRTILETLSPGQTKRTPVKEELRERKNRLIMDKHGVEETVTNLDREEVTYRQITLR